MIQFIFNNIYYFIAFSLILIGLYGVMAKKNILKVIMALGLMDTGINLFLVAIGFIKSKSAPIITKTFHDTSAMVDPVPQALVLTAIVIGLSILSLSLSLAIKLFQHYKTLNLDKIRGLKW